MSLGGSALLRGEEAVQCVLGPGRPSGGRVESRACSDKLHVGQRVDVKKP